MNNMFNRSIGILVHYELKFLRISGTLSLEATNTPGTAKVLGSNLTRTFFFKQDNLPCKNMSAYYMSAYVKSA